MRGTCPCRKNRFRGRYRSRVAAPTLAALHSFGIAGVGRRRRSAAWRKSRRDCNRPRVSLRHLVHRLDDTQLLAKHEQLDPRIGCLLRPERRRVLGLGLSLLAVPGQAARPFLERFGLRRPNKQSECQGRDYCSHRHSCFHRRLPERPRGVQRRPIMPGIRGVLDTPGKPGRSLFFRRHLLLAVGDAVDRAVPVVGTSSEPSFIGITSTGRPIYLLSSRKPVMNGSVDFMVPSLFSLTDDDIAADLLGTCSRSRAGRMMAFL